MADVKARQRLRSSSSSSLIVSRTRLFTVGDWVFPVAAARVWNSLPDLVTSAPSVAVFRPRLKIHLFNISFPSPLWLYSAHAVTLSCFGHYNRSSLLTYFRGNWCNWFWPLYGPPGVLTSNACQCQDWGSELVRDREAGWRTWRQFQRVKVEDEPHRRRTAVMRGRMSVNVGSLVATSMLEHCVVPVVLRQRSIPHNTPYLRKNSAN